MEKDNQKGHLINGSDIYTVSKMLGHRDLKTTQVYAKIVDHTKRTAAEESESFISNKKGLHYGKR